MTGQVGYEEQAIMDRGIELDNTSRTGLLGIHPLRKIAAVAALMVASIGPGGHASADYAGSGKLLPGEKACVDVGHPGEFAIMNATITEPDGPGFATVAKSTADYTRSSTNNYSANETIPNLTISEIGPDGKSCITSMTSTHSILDLSGFLSGMTPASPDGPLRILDTRDSLKSPTGGAKQEAGHAVCVDVGHAGDYAVANFTITEPDAAGFATVHNTQSTWNSYSNNNYTAGETVPILTTTLIGADGKLCETAQQRTHALLDLSGFIDGSKVTPASSAGPVRLYDTRDPNGITAGRKLDAGEQLCVYVGHPGDSAVANATVTEPIGSGFATVFKTGADWIKTSNGNYGAGQTRPNLTITEIGSDGNLCFASLTKTHALMDLVGFISKTIVVPASPTGAVRELDTRTASSALHSGITLIQHNNLDYLQPNQVNFTCSYKDNGPSFMRYVDLKISGLIPDPNPADGVKEGESIKDTLTDLYGNMLFSGESYTDSNGVISFSLGKIVGPAADAIAFRGTFNAINFTEATRNMPDAQKGQATYAIDIGCSVA